MKKRAVNLQDGSSVITGYDVGPYPLHKFRLAPEPAVDFPLRLISAGDDEWIAGCRRKRINSNTFAVEFVRSGIFHYTQNGRQYDVAPDAAFLVHTGADNEMAATDRATKKTMIMSGKALPAILRQLSLDHADVIKISRPEALAGLIDRAHDICGGSGPGRAQAAAALGYQVLLELAGDYSSRNYPGSLVGVIGYMQDNLAEPLTVEKLCRYGGMSRAALHRMFAQYLECSPIEYLIRLKTARARELLACPWYSIKEVAQLTGYSNQLYFSAEFKKRTGVSPKAFRQGS
jgi:AraC-like DNA-binding protein